MWKFHVCQIGPSSPNCFGHGVYTIIVALTKTVCEATPWNTQTSLIKSKSLGHTEYIPPTVRLQQGFGWRDRWKIGTSNAVSTARPRLIILNYVYVCVCISAPVCGYLQKPEKASDPLELGVTGEGELPAVGAGNQTQFFARTASTLALLTTELS